MHQKQYKISGKTKSITRTRFVFDFKRCYVEKLVFSWVVSYHHYSLTLASLQRLLVIMQKYDSYLSEDSSTGKQVYTFTVIH